MIRMVKPLAMGLVLTFGAAAPAHANWVRADSPHFVVYADDSEKDAVRFAVNLERFHAAMLLVTGRKDSVPSPSNRVTIFADGSTRQISKLLGDKSGRVAGFYSPRASGSRAFVPDIQNKSGENDFSMTILLHEYAHHFLLSSSRLAMPRWFDEGAAEFYSSAKFGKDGSVQIGRPAYHRGLELTYAAKVTAEELLDRALYDKRHGIGFDSFYGRSWALYHYLVFDEERKGQLGAYARAIAAGLSDRAAAEKAFGDLGQLNADLDRYLKSLKMATFNLPPERLPAAPVRVTTLSAGESAVLPLVIRSQRGVNREKALALLPQVQAVAAQYPQDAAVLTALAEAEHDAGNDAASIAAADKAIALDKTRVNAYVQKGYSLFRIAESTSGDAAAAAYKAAMEPFQTLNAIENDNPMPLIYFYRSYVGQHKEPPELARHALERASELAPFDRGLAFQAALMQAREGKIALSTAGLRILGANPHGGSLATTASKLAEEIGKLPEGTKWSGQDPQSLDDDETPDEPKEPGAG